jgi:serralysin
MCTLCAALISPDTNCPIKSAATDAVAAGIDINEGGTDVAADTSTTASVSVGGSFVGGLGFVGDEDWVSISLGAGETVVIGLEGTGAAPLSDPLVEIWDSTGTTRLGFDDDGGAGLNSSLTFTATEAGTYYINATSFGTNKTGEYTVTVGDSEMDVWTHDQIADYLTDGYWNDTGRVWRAFDVAPGGTISVDFTELSTVQQQVATWAFQAWSNVTGLVFDYVADTAADIFFNRDSTSGPTAFNSSSYSGNQIIQSSITISDSWVDQYGTTLDSYTTTTFIHEIGHALGLGHAGYYNGAASYTTTPGQGLGYNQYLNDSWQASVMSYMSQTENTWLNASYAPALSAMMADIIAIQDLYGTTGAIRTGDTTYGENSTAGGYLDQLVGLNTNPFSFTIYDEGGIDTLDMGSSSYDQVVDIDPESASDVNGGVGNVLIARGTVLENVILGGGNDTVTGNDADNLIAAGAGTNTVDGGLGDDTVVFSGLRSAYTITTNGDLTTVSTTSEVTVVENVEYLQFSDLTESLVANALPEVSIADVSLSALEWSNIGSSVDYFDADGDAAVGYQVWDSEGGDNFWLLNSGYLDASNGYYFTADRLDDLWVRGEADAGTQTLWMRAWDGEDYGAWENFDLTTEAQNTPPVAALDDVTVGPDAWTNVGTSVSYSDADGDAAVGYQVWDSEGGDSFWLQNSGYLDAGSGYYFTADRVDNLWLRGDADDSSQTLWIRAWDGEEYGAWDSFEFTTQSANTAPDVAADPITTATGGWHAFGSDVTYSDADGDAPVQYELWDSEGADSFWVLYSGFVDASSGYVIDADQLNDTWLLADSTASDQTLMIRAHDGTDWGAWESFVFTSAVEAAEIA